MSTKAVPFFNFTDKPFSHTWDSVPYEFDPMQSYMMEDWKAEHFAKHLVNHVLNLSGKSVADQSRESLLRKALPKSDRIVEVEESKIETELMNMDGPKAKVGGKKKKEQEEGAFESGV